MRNTYVYWYYEGKEKTGAEQLIKGKVEEKDTKFKGDEEIFL